MMNKEVSIKVNLPVFLLKDEGGYYTMESPALELATQGETKREVRTRFKELVTTFFEELLSEGTFDQAMEELGWVKRTKNWAPPVKAVSKDNQLPILVPVPSSTLGGYA